jgi:hypothetical protein
LVQQNPSVTGVPPRYTPAWEGAMSNKPLLFLIGLTIGFASFAAVGTTTSLLMAEVQELVTTQTQPAPASYAQIRPDTDHVTR